KTALHVLSMCVRALDFCPPVDITFGDYLRAIITADHEMVREDPFNYRLAFIDAFRRRGIYPKGIKTLSEESLRHRNEWDGIGNEIRAQVEIIAEFLREYREAVIYETNRENIHKTSRKFISGTGTRSQEGLHQRLWLKFDNWPEFEALTGLVFSRDW